MGVVVFVVKYFVTLYSPFTYERYEESDLAIGLEILCVVWAMGGAQVGACRALDVTQ